jgi:putative OPT family oligopeptide transporter
MATSNDNAPVKPAQPSNQGLPPEAYEEIPGDQYKPFIPASREIPELTFKAVFIGVVLGIVFGAANAYLGLKVGLTVNASIPAAVMSIAVFHFIRRGTILETNIVQTLGSAGESVAAGVIFTIPALFVWGMDVEQLQVFTLASLGGLLGVLFMVPLRRFLISREHGKLPFPEGTACAEVQVAGETGGSKARLVFGGLGLGGLYKFLADSHAVKLWTESPALNLPGKAVLGADGTPELLGVGYIIGWRIALVMFSGGALAWLVLIPLINWWGGSQVIYPGQVPVSDMSSGDIWNRYIRYVGAGGVAYGGVITLVKSLPTIVESIRIGLSKIKEAAQSQGKEQKHRRTDRDLSLKVVGGGALVIALALDLIPFIPVNFVSALLMVIFAFFFVTVSSRIVGLIGASSNPVSGMTIATLLATSLIFVAMGMADAADARTSVLAVGAVVCIAAALAGDTSQDLKTGFLVGATPWKQQTAEIIGVLTSSTVMGAVLIMLHGSYGIGSSDLPAPQATLMSLVIDGVLNANLPWSLVLVGAGLAAVVEHVFRQPSLAFAVGLYLPISLTTPILLGGGLRHAIERRHTGKERQEKRQRGVLFSSGLIAGAALVGVMIAAVIFFSEKFSALKWVVNHWTVDPGWMGTELLGGSLTLGGLVGTAIFAGLAWVLYRVTMGGDSSDSTESSNP